jgi:exodeoxyribonuclease VII small subunit
MNAKKEKFEDYLRIVEDVVKNLEGGKLGLEESIDKYEQGIKALRKCYEILETAEKRIEVLIKEKGETKIEEFKEDEQSPQGDLREG